MNKLNRRPDKYCIWKNYRKPIWHCLLSNEAGCIAAGLVIGWLLSYVISLL